MRGTDTRIEKLWQQITQQDAHVHDFPTVDVLTEKVEQALGKFANAPQEVLALCTLPTELAPAAPDRFLKKSVS